MNTDYPVVDISHWQENPDFAKMASEGVIGVIHKATESTGYVDDDYAPRRPKAEAAGLLWGAYHFLRPGNMEAQARHFVETAGDIDLLAADHEDPGVSLDDLKTFLREVENLTGKKAVDLFRARHQRPSPRRPFRFRACATSALAGALHHRHADMAEGDVARLVAMAMDGQGVGARDQRNADCNRYASTEEDLVNEWTGEEPTPIPPTPEPGKAAEVTITIKITSRGADVTVVTG